MSFVLRPLPYAYDALTPYIDARTMEIHYTKHHQSYVDNLNAALSGYPALCDVSLEHLFTMRTWPTDELERAVRNYGGGHYNHTFFWSLMKKNGGGEPVGLLLDAIKKQFGSVELFKKQFAAAALNIFGSGWAWLVMDEHQQIRIMVTANQDNPLKDGLRLIIGLDVWEHAYYLHYQNRRGDYINSWWHVIDWEYADYHYRLALGVEKQRMLL